MLVRVINASVVHLHCTLRRVTFLKSVFFFSPTSVMINEDIYINLHLAKLKQLFGCVIKSQRHVKALKRGIHCQSSLVVQHSSCCHLKVEDFCSSVNLQAVMATICLYSRSNIVLPFGEGYLSLCGSQKMPLDSEVCFNFPLTRILMSTCGFYTKTCLFSPRYRCYSQDLDL